MPTIITPNSPPPNWVTVDPDTPPATADAMDDEFSGTSLDPKWTWVNQASATVSLDHGRLLIANPIEAAHNVHAIIQPAPVGNWKIRAKINCPNMANVYQGIGPVVRNSSSGKLITWYQIYHTTYSTTSFSILAVRFNSTTSHNSETGGFPSGTFHPVYLEVEYNGTQLLFRYSRNGARFTTIVTEAVSNFLSSFDQVGIAFQVAGAVATQEAFEVDWFRRIS